MASRQMFSESEKICLQELIVKFKLNSTATIGAGNPAVKKSAWMQLTNEFNSIETNTKRTESQLKKCWDNLKNRRKLTLAAEKRERMRTGGGPCVVSQPSTSTLTQESMLIDEDALAEVTDVELTFAVDSDVIIPGIGLQVPTQEEGVEDLTEQACGQQTDETLNASQSTFIQEHVVQSRQGRTVSAKERPVAGQHRNARTSSRLSDYEGATSQTSGARNIRNQVIQEEFALRGESYRRAQAREDELHQLKVAERKWLAAAAEELYKKNCLEREIAEIKLKELKNK